MRFIYAMLAFAIASTAFAQSRANSRWTPLQTPTPVATEKPAYREDTVTINPDIHDPDVRQRSNIPYSKLPLEYADILTQADQRKQAAQQKFYDRIAEPMLSPDGKELVGIVGNRYLTKDDLNKRADLMMKTLPSPEKVLGANAAVAIAANADLSVSAVDEKQREEDRRILVEGRVLDDWARAATMAVHAEHAATAVPELRVTDAEVDRAIQNLSAEAQINAGKIPVALQTVMFSERELRQEVRDSILVDKYMKEYVKRTISEQQMKEVFAKTPALFLEPAKVRAWAMFIAKEGLATPKQSSKTKGELSKWRRSLNGCKTDEDFKELGAKIVKSESRVILSALPGWIQSTDTLDPDLQNALFELKPGETSDVIESLSGYHIYKVLERIESEKTYYANVLPRIVDYLANSLKDGVYDNIKGQYGLRMAASGLKKWTTTGPARDVVAEQVAAALGTSVTLTQTPVGVDNEPNLRLLHPRTSTGARRRFSGNIPPVESVVGGKAATRASKPIDPLATPRPFISPSK